MQMRRTYTSVSDWRLRWVRVPDCEVHGRQTACEQAIGLDAVRVPTEERKRRRNDDEMGSDACAVRTGSLIVIEPHRRRRAAGMKLNAFR